MPRAPATRSWCGRPTTATRSTACPRAAPRRSRGRWRSPRPRCRDDPLPPWRRAEILDRAAHLLAGRIEEFARIVAEEAAKPIKTARVEAAACRVDLHVRVGRSAPARRRDGAARRVRRRRGQDRLHAARADRRRRRDQPVQLPAQPGRAQARARDRRRLPGGAEAGVADAAVGDRAGRAAPRRVRPPERATSAWSPAAAAPSATRSSTIPTSRSSRSPAHPRSGWGIKARAPQQEGRPRARQQRAGDHRARRRRRHRGGEDRGRRVQPRRASRASRPSGSTCTSRSPTASSTSWCPRSRRWSSATRSTRRPTCRRSISTGERERVESWIDEAVAAGAKVAHRRRRAQRRARADRADRTCSPT